MSGHTAYCLVLMLRVFMDVIAVAPMPDAYFLPPPHIHSIRRLIAGPTRPRALTFEFSPQQARRRGCDPHATIEFLYANGYKYTHNQQLVRSSAPLPLSHAYLCSSRGAFVA